MRKQSPLRQGLEIIYKAGQLYNGYSIDEMDGRISVTMNGIGDCLPALDAAKMRELGWKLDEFDGVASWEFVNPNGLRAITVDNVLDAIGVPH